MAHRHRRLGRAALARAVGALSLTAAALVLAATATASTSKSYTLPDAGVTITVAPNGALKIQEAIAYSFDGSFTGAYRDIPLVQGQTLTDVGVTDESGKPYSPGGCSDLGCTSPAGTYGVAHENGFDRIVWHYQAFDENRVFYVSYTFNRAAIAYDDVVDINLFVWGKEWKVGLGRLEATISAPGKIVRGWGNPVYVRGDVQLEGKKAVLRAVSIPSHQFVQLRILVPRKAFSSTSDMIVKRGRGLQAIIGQEKADAATLEREHAGVVNAEHHPWKYIGYIFLLGLLPALLVIGLVYLVLGREPSTGYDREYEQEPPTDTQPALVPTLLNQGGEAGSFEFTATLFDLIRRGVYASKPVTTEKSTFAGLHKEQISDLEISAGTPDANLTTWEKSVASVVDSVIEDGPVPLSQFRDRITKHRSTMAPKFTAFKSRVKTETKSRKWFAPSGALPLALTGIAFVVVGVLVLFVVASRWRSAYPRWVDVELIGLGVAGLLNGTAIFATFAFRRLYRRCTKPAALEAQRWNAFRNYLTDFPRLQEAAPATLELWERYLVYGITFGIADRVLKAAHIAMPAEMVQSSTIYWISPGGNLGGGASSMAIGDLASGFGSALAPPSSGGGGGGGFSGGGGGGFGGGGGGAW